MGTDANSARRPMEEIPKIAKRYPGHVDIPRMLDGSLGAGFFTVWTPCPVSKGMADDPDALRDALEILDLIQNMVSQQSEHLQFARSSADILRAHEQGKIAALIGVEGTHFLGNSLSTVRLLAQAGARYMTLTHICHSAFASSNGGGDPMRAVHPGNGLTDLGRELIKELNRLGIMVDLSHTSDETAIQAIALSKAPVVWTHSGARSIWDHPRNIPDAILSKIGNGPGRCPGIVHSVFYPPFIGPVDSANTSRVADHIEYIARNVGKKHVGIGSDFDGMYSSVIGLEDASSYPNLVRALLQSHDQG
jgi:membrane dipeptidase